MIHLPERPFSTEDFSLRGGGIDFLGLRWVNLTMVGQHLIPELNNVTTDMGTFFLGAWIPWKFRQLCSDARDYTEKNYRLFREKAEVAMSLTFRDDLGIARVHGQVRNRIGITQACSLPSQLTFRGAKRTEQNSLYAAAIYGPALRALGLIKTYHSQAREGARAVNIPIPPDDPDVVQILRGVDASLRKAPNSRLLASLDAPDFTRKDIWKLAEAGLDPARYRAPEHAALKACFRRKLLPESPNDPGHARTLTTRLVLATLRQHPRLAAQEMRDAWYTGMFEDGSRLRLPDSPIAEHCKRWSCFMARQYQRHAIELFLWCFEDAIGHGCRSIEDVLAYWTDRSKTAGVRIEGVFQKVADTCAGSLRRSDETATSQAWNDKVHAGHRRFEYIHEPQGDAALAYGLNLLAGWHWRMLVREQDATVRHLLSLGGPDRMSMSWFLEWLRRRAKQPIQAFLKDVFSSLIFAQHMRIALARFDGTTQRLRFLIGDGGIEPTVSARADLGERPLPWMPDRLDALIALLCDCDVLAEKDDTIRLGPQADTV